MKNYNCNSILRKWRHISFEKYKFHCSSFKKSIHFCIFLSTILLYKMHQTQFPWVCEPRHEKTWLMLYVSNKGADHSAYSYSLISTFVVLCLSSMISKLVEPKISKLCLVGRFESNLVANPEDRFSHVTAHVCLK